MHRRQCSKDVIGRVACFAKLSVPRLMAVLVAVTHRQGQPEFRGQPSIGHRLGVRPLDDERCARERIVQANGGETFACHRIHALGFAVLVEPQMIVERCGSGHAERVRFG